MMVLTSYKEEDRRAFERTQEFFRVNTLAEPNKCDFDKTQTERANEYWQSSLKKLRKPFLDAKQQ